MRSLLPFLLLSAGLLAPGSGAAPHILVFICDDLSARDVGAYGSIDVRTPHVDALAAHGLLFERAFIASPACAPSRAALLTGLCPARNGAMAFLIPSFGLRFAAFK